MVSDWFWDSITEKCIGWVEVRFEIQPIKQYVKTNTKYSLDGWISNKTFRLKDLLERNLFQNIQVYLLLWFFTYVWIFGTIFIGQIWPCVYHLMCPYLKCVYFSWKSLSIGKFRKALISCYWKTRTFNGCTSLVTRHKRLPILPFGSIQTHILHIFHILTTLLVSNFFFKIVSNLLLN